MAETSEGQGKNKNKTAGGGGIRLAGAIPEPMNFKIQRQLSVALENQPGRLAAVCRILAASGINIRNLSVLDNIEQGVIRIIPTDPEIARQLLTDAGHHIVEADVIVADMPDAPGTLASVSQALADAHINIDYAYGTEDQGERSVRLVLKVSNLPRATQVLNSLPT